MIEKHNSTSIYLHMSFGYWIRSVTEGLTGDSVNHPLVISTE